MGSRTFLTLLVFLAAFLVTGCSTLATATAADTGATPVEALNTPADIIGTVADWQFIEGEGVLLIKGQDSNGADLEATVTVNGQTAIIQRQGNSLKAGQVTDLAAGHHVEVHFAGPVMQSHPQVYAQEVVISIQ